MGQNIFEYCRWGIGFACKNTSSAILYNANDYHTEPGEFLNLKDNAGNLYISHLVGAYNKANMVAAISIGQYFGVSIQQIQNAISDYFPSNNRSQKAEYNGAYIIKDAYNASPLQHERCFRCLL